MKRRCLFLTILTVLLIAALGTGAAGSQRPGDPPPGTVFRQVIPQATGKNGYEDLVLAAELWRSSPWVTVVNSPQAPLTERRRVFQDPLTLQVLGIVRRGLAKPVASPREVLTFETALPELALFRGLGRLLACHLYVLLADGKVAEAIESSRLCLRLGQAVQTDTLVSGLVGVAIGALGMRELGRHLDQLSARDCDLLFQVCLEWLRRPDPRERFLESERSAVGHCLSRLLERLAARGPAVVTDFLDTGDDARELAQALYQEARDEPERFRDTLREAMLKIDRELERVRSELHRLPWERHYPLPEQDGTLAGRLAGMIMPAWNLVETPYTREAAYVRLMAVHCAIRRYKWENGSFPPNLSVLRLEALAVDPFTGEPLRYEPRGDRYRLTSAGPAADPDDPLAEGGRRPVGVTPDD